MTVALEIPNTGTARRTLDRTDAWTELGIGVRGAKTAEEALKSAHLWGWDVRKIGGVTATETSGDSMTTVKMPDSYATVRTNPLTGETDYLGTVGRKYVPVQNEAHAEVLDLLAKESGAVFDRAGAFQGGRKVFLSMQLPQVLNLGGIDHHDLNIAVFNSHDGSSASSVHLTPTRLLCGNMQKIAIRGAKYSHSIPHTVSAEKKITAVHKALFALFDYREAFEREADRLLNTPMTLGGFEQLVNKVWPVPTSPSKRTRTNHLVRVTTLRSLFEDADTQANIRGTAWAAWNAVGEYLDHYAPAKTGEIRAARSLSSSGTVTSMKQKAYDLLALAA
ncbi:DUF932 domain-containing protein [Streptomyces luteireticuli]|uniref:DUF932 domain-containing protein n=1 Tax=Streptomyces luteireticuli TaxID=173858 RepID=UPI003558D5A1